MLEDFKCQIKEVLNLSVQREKVFEKEAKQGLHECDLSDIGDFLSEAENYESSKIEKEIRAVLGLFDEETLLQLATVMYLGRDYDPEEGMPAVEIYQALLNSLSADQNSKDILINMMVSKVPLGTFLVSGFNLLGMCF